MKRPGLELALILVLVAVLSTPVWGAGAARPGTLNYVEGQALIGQQAINSGAVGATALAAGQSLATQSGKAEILLTPGVFLRLGENSSVTMLSPNLTNTGVELNTGQAIVEVDEIHKDNNLRVNLNGATAQLIETGLYDFDADRSQIRVFDGKAVVQEGGRGIEVKGRRAFDLNGGDSAKAQKFDKKAYEDDLYRWSSLRSSYLAEANIDAARTYVSVGWSGSGWYWDPWFSAYTYVPGDGIYYSPFGWGFYSPFVVYRAPLVLRGPYHRHFDRDYRGWRPMPRVGPDGSRHGFRPQPGVRMTPPAHGFGRGFHPATPAPGSNRGFHPGAEFHGGRGRR